MTIPVDWKSGCLIVAVKESTQHLRRERKLLFLAAYFFFSVLVSFAFLLGDLRKLFFVQFGKYEMVVVILYFFYLQPIFLLIQIIAFKHTEIDKMDIVGVDESITLERSFYMYSTLSHKLCMFHDYVSHPT